MYGYVRAPRTIGACVCVRERQQSGPEAGSGWVSRSLGVRANILMNRLENSFREKCVGVYMYIVLNVGNDGRIRCNAERNFIL